MKYTYKDYLKDRDQLHTDIINACKKFRLGTLCHLECTKDNHYQIVVRFADFNEKDFED